MTRSCRSGPRPCSRSSRRLLTPRRHLSPYHSRRAQLVFNDILAGSGISATVISSGDYGCLFPPDDLWWRDRLTLKTVWLEFGKILYWELTPYLEFQG